MPCRWCSLVLPVRNCDPNGDNSRASWTVLFYPRASKNRSKNRVSCNAISAGGRPFPPNHNPCQTHTPLIQHLGLAPQRKHVTVRPASRHPPPGESPVETRQQRPSVKRPTDHVARAKHPTCPHRASQTAARLSAGPSIKTLGRRTPSKPTSHAPSPAEAECGPRQNKRTALQGPTEFPAFARNSRQLAAQDGRGAHPCRAARHSRQRPLRVRPESHGQAGA